MVKHPMPGLMIIRGCTTQYIYIYQNILNSHNHNPLWEILYQASKKGRRKVVNTAQISSRPVSHSSSGTRTGLALSLNIPISSYLPINHRVSNRLHPPEIKAKENMSSHVIPFFHQKLIGLEGSQETTSIQKDVVSRHRHLATG